MHKSKKILILCPYPEGEAASQRLKYEQYFASWKSHGYEIEVSPFFSTETWKILYIKNITWKKIYGTLLGYFRRFFDLLRVKEYDLVYVCMWITPFQDFIFERLFHLFSKKMIFDFDDSIHLEDDPNNRNYFKKLIKNKRKIRSLIKKADSVITSSPFNLDFCIKHNHNSSASYIPCSLDTERFTPAIHQTNKKLSLGWTGTFASIPYLDSIKDVLEESCKIHNLKLVLITNFDYFIPNIDMEVIEWKEISEVQDLQKIDIGIYPLIQSQWALGKGGLKVLQYMSIGIPSISSDYGTATNIIKDGKNGFLVKSKQDWHDKINYLVNNDDVRRQMGAAARRTVEDHYSVTAVSKKYLSVLNNA